MTVALVAGLGTALFAYLLLDELEGLRHARVIRRALLGPGSGRGRPTEALGWLWARASAGEVPLRAIQLAALATVAFVGAALAVRSLTLILLGTALGIAIGYAWVQRQRWTLAARVERQLADAMQVMANALSAGGTLFQALEAAARETPPPLGTLLSAAVRRAQLVGTVDEALRELGDRVGSRDVDTVVAALAIQRTTGGDLARLLRESASFLREEQRLRADARALSAQARYSSQLIGAMPIGLFVLFWVLFPSFIAPLTSTTIGLAVLLYGLLSTALGFYLIWRIATAIERI